MDKFEYDMLSQIERSKEEIICAEDLKPHLKDRTLLYGYTCERETFHVYLKNKEIHVVTYYNDYSGDERKPKNMCEIKVTANNQFVPNKRLYPQRCDYAFCKLLKLKDIHLPFTVWEDEQNKKDFYGFTLEDYADSY